MALFALAIHELTSKIKANLNIRYLDDGCIGGDPQTVLNHASMIRDGLLRLAWRLIILNVSYSSITDINNNKPKTSKFFQDQFTSLSIPDPIHWQLLGSRVPPAAGIQLK